MLTIEFERRRSVVRLRHCDGVGAVGWRYVITACLTADDESVGIGLADQRVAGVFVLETIADWRLVLQSCTGRSHVLL